LHGIGRAGLRLDLKIIIKIIRIYKHSSLFVGIPLVLSLTRDVLRLGEAIDGKDCLTGIKFCAIFFPVLWLRPINIAKKQRQAEKQ